MYYVCLAKRNRERVISRPKHRLIFSLLGMFFVTYGTLNVFAGKLYFLDHRNLIIFSPFLIVVGLVCLIVAFGRPINRDSR
jgi:hypothetical protein